MRRRRHKNFDILFVIILLIITVGYFMYNGRSSESRGVQYYAEALNIYKNSDYEIAYQYFGKVPTDSGLKTSALFRQARCATNMGKKELAVKKYKRIINSNSKSSIVPISQYNMALLLFELEENKKAKNAFKKIIKKYPTSTYAIASEYYLGLIEENEIYSNEKKQAKAKQKALNHFKTYLINAPDGRYAIKCINEINKLGIKLTNFDNLLIAKAYYNSGDYDKAKDYLNKTTLAESWTDFAKNEFKLGNKEKCIYYTELGLQKHAEMSSQEDVFSVIDTYITAFPTRKDAILKLNSLNVKSTGADYIKYLNCNEVVAGEHKENCFKSLYEKHSDGQFSAEALYNVFISRYLQKKYYDAQRLGDLHLKKFPNVKSSPAITYYMGKIALKLKQFETANNYFKKVLSEFPDTYYAYRANYNLNKEDGSIPFYTLNIKPFVFQYKKSKDENLVVKLAYLKDYDLVEELCKNDKFIQSWIAYEKGSYTISAILARNAMDELTTKPHFDDLRWRLVYPTHYYDMVTKANGKNNPIILESIIKEESHFNPYATSYVGAKGLMQLMPATYNEVVKLHNLPTDLNSEFANIKAGSLYYESLKKALANKDLYAISAYNGGIGSVTQWFSKLVYSDMDEFVEQIPYPETKNYVKKVFRTYWVYGNVY